MPGLAEIFVMCFAPAIFWLGFFYDRAKYGAPHSRALLALFLAGLFAGPISLLAFQILESFSFYADLTSVHALEDEATRFAYCVFAIGPVEELSKFVVAWALMFRRREFASPIDGLTFSAAVGLGFASIENWYAMLAGEEVLWARAITLPFVHMLFSSFWGVGLSFARFGSTPAERSFIYASIPLSFVFHGIYDYITLSDLVPNLLILPLVLLLWYWLTTSLRRLGRSGSLSQNFRVREEPATNSDAGEEPGRPVP